VPKEVHLFLGKFIFHLVAKNFVLTQFTQNIFQVFYMLLCGLGVYQYIIHVDDHELIQLFVEDGVHKGGECWWNVTQPKWHH
jgi:uncharacterized membrane protein AbrB (regulator of aidB expression)